jgi:hypothetical protein
VKTSNLTQNEPAGLCNGDVMFPVRYKLGFMSQKKAFFVVTAIKTSTLATKFTLP